MSTRFLTEFDVADRTQISLGTLRRWRLENKGQNITSLAPSFAMVKKNLPPGSRRNRRAARERHG